MYLLWLRVAAILYAAASIAIFPAVLYGLVRWRKTCVHLGGMAYFFHFVSCVEMLVQAHRWMPVGTREIESMLGFAIAGLFFPPHVGQEVLVQAVKDPMKTKGARLTTDISLPGRFVVFVPQGEGLGVSRRLPDEERTATALDALMDYLEQFCKKALGFL